MKKLFAALVVVTALAIGSPARAADASGFTAALRAGYGLALGDADGTTKLSDIYSGQIPFWADVGYRIDRSMFVGAFFQYGLAFLNKDNFVDPTTGTPVCNQSGVSCSGYSMRFGVEFLYNFMPDASFAPWGGIGVGYEIAKASLDVSGVSASVGVKGFEFANLQLGGDYRVSPDIAVGPYVAFSIGQYSTLDVDTPLGSASGDIADKKMHMWLQFGVKGTFDF